MNKIKNSIAASLAALGLGGCASHASLDTVDYVDLDRFMGDWYVIANIPTFVEKGAHNAVETYTKNADGTIATTFVFRKDSYEGKEKQYTPKAWVTDTNSNAVWGMQFIWPIKADYRIVYLTQDYSVTIIARNKRDYVWLMARTPEIEESEYKAAMDLIDSMGYDMNKIRRVPQKW